jgi:hypothetical protein
MSNLESNTNPERSSSTSIFLRIVWNVNWRALGSQQTCRTLQEDGQVQLHDHLRATKYARSHRIPTERTGDILSTWPY